MFATTPGGGFKYVFLYFQFEKTYIIQFDDLRMLGVEPTNYYMMMLFSDTSFDYICIYIYI